LKLLSPGHVIHVVPRFYFNLFNDETITDHEGVQLTNAAEALQAAARMARGMAAESVREGRLILDHRIEVNNANGVVGIVHFRDVVQVLPTANGIAD
jgi:hypothetical protein